MTEQQKPSRTPRIGRSMQEARNEKLAEHLAEQDIETLNPSDAERAIGDYDKIVAAREADKAQTLARLNVTPPPPATAKVRPTSRIEDILTKFVEPTAAADAERTAARKAEAEALVGDLLVRGQAALTRLGQMRTKHLARIQNVLALDFEAIRKGLPHDWVINEGARASVSPSRNALHNLQQMGKEAVTALTSSFSGAQVDRTDVDPPDLGAVMQEIQRVLAGGQTHDNVPGMLRSGLVRLNNHLRVWVQRAETTVAAAETFIKRFDAAVQRAESILAPAQPQANVTPTPERKSIPIAAEVPKRIGGTSAIDFDPRALDRSVAAPKDNTTVTPLMGGHRVTTGGA